MPKGRYQHGVERPVAPPPPVWAGTGAPPPWGAPPPVYGPVAPPDPAHPYAPPPATGGPSAALIVVGVALGVALSVLAVAGVLLAGDPRDRRAETQGSAANCQCA